MRLALCCISLSDYGTAFINSVFSAFGGCYSVGDKIAQFRCTYLLWMFYNRVLAL
jgi:hypothetical protein